MNDNFLRVYTANGRKYDLPVEVYRDGREFVAEHPAYVMESNITEVRLFSDEIDSPVRFILESLILSETETGFWTITLSENEFGSPQYDLEYYSTDQYGKRIRNSLILEWDHEEDELTAN